MLSLYQLKANITQGLQSKDPMQLLIQACAMESNEFFLFLVSRSQVATWE